ncbi:MAG: hypothetical protein F6K28_62765 [Microcoleus sp. SIO2G3]|nr:hypothetical protein [Microcoleus sp. SIO2G3]
MERAKGIYSFSHLTFHEYFTAREIVVGKQSSDEALQNLVRHLTEKRWQEVFLLAVGMSPSADCLLLLMKEKVDALVAVDEKLQQFLMWICQKSDSLEVPYKLAAVRAFYFARYLGCNLNLTLARNLEPTLVHNLEPFPEHDLVRDLDHSLAFNYARDHARDFALTLTFNLAVILTRDIDLILKQALQQLSQQLPDPRSKEEIIKQWWEANGRAWTEQLRAVMIKYRNIGHDWQFSEQQEELLIQYYDANKLLVDCLNSDCYVSREVRQKIEDELLLPIAEINKRQQEIL